MKRVVLGLTAALVIGGLPGSALASFTCSTVARSNGSDPEFFLFARRFPEISINQAGDVLFLAKPKGTPTRLYLYPNVGAPSIVTRVNAPSPDGGVFRSFSRPTLNDAGDIAFQARTSFGRGVFLRPSGGSIESAAIATGPSPSGGTFQDFNAISRINASRKVAFAALVVNGPDGVFLRDGVADTTTSIALEGDSAGGGREFCGFQSVALGSAGAAFLADTKLDCLDTDELSLAGLFFWNGTTVSSVAFEGDATPVPGTTYLDFEGPPEMNASDHVLFRAEASGSVFVTGEFLFDPTGPTTSTVMTTGEVAPGTTGFVGRIDRQDVADGDVVFVKGGIQAGTAKSGVFQYDGTPDAVLLNTDPVPTDQFGVGSRYARLVLLAVSGSGNRIAVTARVKDTVVPRNKIGVLRCAP